jgi:UDP:flavonoid glycosyltransferase YjiC (YdhE family)
MLPAEITGKKILISPLDWGMGHTTRCVALIRQLIQKNEILFAGNESQVEFMRREFEGIKTVFLKGYNVTLDSQKSSYLQLSRQLVKIKKAISYEHKFAEEIAQKENIDLILSDNHYGFWSSVTKNILLTHQLRLQIPTGKKMVNNRLKKWIEKFDECWIPDSADKPVCGALLDADLKIPRTFIGQLARFRTEDLRKEYRYLFIASGPEPERSHFAKKMIGRLREQGGHFAVVGFREENTNPHFFNGATTGELEILVNSSETVIARAGYTTIMEMIALHKKAILIPTPGQFEQEYLAKTVSAENITFIDEKRFFNDEYLLNHD